MTRKIPRLLFVAVGPPPSTGSRVDSPLFAVDCALETAQRAVARGLEVAVIVAGSDRDVPGAQRAARLVEVTGRAVHRVDVRLMSTPVLQRIVSRVAAGTDLCLLIAPLALEAGDPHAIDLMDMTRALDAPAVVCADLAGLDRGIDAVRGALGRADRFVSPDAPEPLLLLAEHREGRPGRKLAGALGARTVLVAPPRHGDELRLEAPDVDTLLEHARVAPLIPRAHQNLRRHVRARVGIVIDECFDLYDEESLAQFEAAGAQLVPVPVLGGEPVDGLDGLIIGDGPVEAFSWDLAEATSMKDCLRTSILAGTPTLAGGGGMAFLTEGLRTAAGGRHAFLGVLSGHAVVIDGDLPRGHVEVELDREALIGPAGTRLRGYAQRRWLVRGLDEDVRANYRCHSGPPDVGAQLPQLLAVHFRPYWPSYPRAATHFVDRCLQFAAARDSAGAVVDLGGESDE